MAKRIEEEIKSSTFRSEYHKAALNILVTSNWINNSNVEIFKKYNLTGQQYNVLRILRGQHPVPCTVLAIRERMIDKMSDVSRIVERLRVAGYVDRVSCSKDRRAVDIRITQEGLNLLETMKKEEATLDKLMENLSEEEVKQLNELLDKLRN